MESYPWDSSTKDVKIFNAICNAVTDIEFKSAQHQFFEKNAHVFSDAEEN